MATLRTRQAPNPEGLRLHVLVHEASEVEPVSTEGRVTLMSLSRSLAFGKRIGA
jgi:hypothetical protein